MASRLVFRTRSFRTLLIVLAPALLLVAPIAASAQAPLPEERIQALFDQSLDHYDGLQLEDAVRVLEEALGVAENYSVESELVADVYLMLGIVEQALYGDADRTIERFVEGLSVSAEAELNPYYTNPDLEAMLDRARTQVRPTDTDPVEPEPVITHHPVVTIRAGQPITILAETADGVGVRRLVLGYRGQGETRYHLVNMQLTSPTEFFATISGVATDEAGIQLEYFLQAVGADDQVLDTSGSPNAPHVVVILDATPDTGDKLIGDIVSFGLGVGTGGGLATGEPLVMRSRVDLNPGVALTPLHFFVDLSFYFADVFQFGPFLRLQTVLLQNGVEIETVVGGKLKWFFLADDPTRMYASLGGGWGNVRHTVDLSPTIEFVDTTREGPFHGGVGFGFVHMFTDNVGFLVDVYTMVLFDQVSVQLDLNVGAVFSF